MTAELVAPTPVVGTLSPSRAAEFKTCPLRYRLRNIDRLPETPSPAAVRGTLVHAVLDELYDLPPDQRTPAAAEAILPGAWAHLLESEPGLGELFATSTEAEAWLASARPLLASYFRLEDPATLEPVWRERYVEVAIGDVRLRGVLDRLDVGADGDVRIVDYKTGASPLLAHEGAALFQLKFYALLLWRTRGVVPGQLRLIYLTDTTTLTYCPDADELAGFERTVLAVWDAIRLALVTGDFRPSPGRACQWCDYRTLCPAFGGTPPPYPYPARLTDPRDDAADAAGPDQTDSSDAR